MYCFCFTVLLAVLTSSIPRCGGCGSSESLDAKDNYDQAKKNDCTLENGFLVLIGNTNGSKAALSAAGLTNVKYDECVGVLVGSIIVAESLIGNLSYDNLATNRAMLTFGKTVIGAGGSCCRIDFLGVSESRSASAAATVAYHGINAGSSLVIVSESVTIGKLTNAAGLGSFAGCVSPLVTKRLTVFLGANFAYCLIGAGCASAYVRSSFSLG